MVQGHSFLNSTAQASTTSQADYVRSFNYLTFRGLWRCETCVLVGCGRIAYLRIIKKSSIDSSYGALRPALWTTTAMMLKSAPMSFEDRSEVMSRLKARLPVFPHYYSKGRERGQIWERQQKRSF